MRHSLREQGVVVSDTGAWCHANSSSDTSTDVGDDATIKVGGNHDIKLGGVLDQLHGAVVHNHLFIFDEWVVLGDSSCLFQKQTINQLHDVGFVDDGNFLPAAEVGKLEGVLNESEGFLFGGYLEGLHHTWVNFVFNAGELTLGVFPDDGDVHI